MPDATTLLHFRHLLERHALTRAIFAEVNALSSERSILLREGTLVDATIIAAAPPPRTRRSRRTLKCNRFARASFPYVRWQVAAKRGKLKATAEGLRKEVAKALEKAKAQLRAYGEHPLHVVKNLFKHRKVRYRGLAKNTAQLHTLFALANLVIAKPALT